MNKLFRPFSLILLALFCWPALAQNFEYEDEDEYDQDDLPFVEIKDVANLEELGKQARNQGKVIMLEMSATYCEFCRLLEEEIIKPMLRSGDYTDNVLIRKLEIDGYYTMKNISGSKTSPAELANQFDIFVTPTLLFLDGKGNEVSERILGVNSLDYFGAYVDEALEEGRQKINSLN